jgi:hypothetical protein
MKMTYLTRHDEGVGEGVFDSIRWALETHVKVTDHGEFFYAMLYGNEDAPDRIEFWRNDLDGSDDLPDFVWCSDGLPPWGEE